jgi:hypothetical protein
MRIFGTCIWNIWVSAGQTWVNRNDTGDVAPHTPALQRVRTVSWRPCRLDVQAPMLASPPRPRLPRPHAARGAWEPAPRRLSTTSRAPHRPCPCRLPASHAHLTTGPLFPSLFASKRSLAGYKGHPASLLTRARMAAAFLSSAARHCQRRHQASPALAPLAAQPPYTFPGPCWSSSRHTLP